MDKLKQGHLAAPGALHIGRGVSKEQNSHNPTPKGDSPSNHRTLKLSLE